MVGAFIISTRSETVAVNARVDKTDIAQGYMQKQIDEQARNNNDRWSDVKSSMLRIETRIEGISDSMSKKEDRRTQGETKR